MKFVLLISKWNYASNQNVFSIYYEQKNENNDKQNVVKAPLKPVQFPAVSLVVVKAVVYTLQFTLQEVRGSLLI